MTLSLRTGPDENTPRRPAMRVTFVGHSTTVIDIGGIRIMTDPFLRSRLGPLERHGPLPDPAALDVDVIVISHGHPDHFDRWSLEALPGSPRIIVPERLGPRLGGGALRAQEVHAGDVVRIRGVTITAVPARHWISPGAPRAQPLGFVIDGGLRAYFAGDTGRFAAMRDVAGGVDLALLPIWTWGPHLGPGHLGPRSAAEVGQDLAARAIVPIHWGTLYPRHLHRVWGGPLREPGERFARHVRDLAPEIEVHVLQPGQSATIGG